MWGLGVDGSPELSCQIKFLISVSAQHDERISPNKRAVKNIHVIVLVTDILFVCLPGSSVCGRNKSAGKKVALVAAGTRSVNLKDSAATLVIPKNCGQAVKYIICRPDNYFFGNLRFRVILWNLNENNLLKTFLCVCRNIFIYKWLSYI